MSVNFTVMATQLSLANDKKLNNTAAAIPATDFDALIEQINTTSKVKETAAVNRHKVAISHISDPQLVKQQMRLTVREQPSTVSAKSQLSELPFVQGSLSAATLQQSQLNGAIAKQKSSLVANPDTLPEKWVSPPDLGKYLF